MGEPMVPPLAPSFFASSVAPQVASRGSKFPFGGRSLSPQIEDLYGPCQRTGPTPRSGLG